MRNTMQIEWDPEIISLGYPECCMEAFPHRSDRSNIFLGTGFLPCPACAEKDPVDLLKEIETNRTNSMQFPFAFMEEYTCTERARFFTSLHSEMRAALHTIAQESL